MTGSGTPAAATAAELHGANVSDAGTFAADLQRRLLPSWQLVCHASDLPSPGTAIRFDFGGQSALLLRRPDGGLAAFRNVCRHRGSRLVDGDVATGLAFCIDSRIRCPAHGWVYDARGALVDLPRAGSYAGLDRSSWGLHPLDVGEVGGWVLVAFATPPESLQQHCGAWFGARGAEQPLELRRLAEPRLHAVAANWRLVCADRLDLRLLAARAAALPLDVSSLESARDGGVVGSSASLNPTATGSWSARAYVGQLAAEPGKRGFRYDAAFIWPNAFIEIAADQWTITQALPIAPERTLLREVSYGKPDPSPRLRAMRYLQRRLRGRYLAARIQLLERLQAGAGQSAPGPLADDERDLAWFIARLAGAKPPR
jgi:phenylpropionate dioxygenase-like ring-hydroxylating dioxygenase large terminal subunit